MKVLLDTCVSFGAVHDVRDAGHDTVWVGQWEQDAGDEAILARAIDESRALVTLDKDFGELAIVRGRSHSGIIRLVGLRAGQQGSTIVRILGRYEAELADGAILTVEPWRVRVRSAK